MRVPRSHVADDVFLAQVNVSLFGFTNHLSRDTACFIAILVHQVSDPALPYQALANARERQALAQASRLGEPSVSNLSLRQMGSLRSFLAPRTHAQARRIFVESPPFQVPSVLKYVAHSRTCGKYTVCANF